MPQCKLRSGGAALHWSDTTYIFQEITVSVGGPRKGQETVARFCKAGPISSSDSVQNNEADNIVAPKGAAPFGPGADGVHGERRVALQRHDAPAASYRDQVELISAVAVVHEVLLVCQVT